MGAIIDRNAAPEAFGPSRTEAGEKFFDWINAGAGRLVVGGKLLRELSSTQARKWIRQAILSKRVKITNDVEINASTKKLQDEGGFKSNDLHILALAKVSGARLLYSNDKNLQQDFKNKKLIDQPRGKVYSTISGGGKFEYSHKRLLRLKKKNLCGAPQ